MTSSNSTPSKSRKRKQTTKKEPPRKRTLPKEKRRHPRLFVELPLDYFRKGKKADFGGIVKNASEGGILVYLPEKMEVGEMLKVEIYFPKGLELQTIQGLAKIVWADLASKETWREHRYGLKFNSLPKGTIQRLRNLLREVGKTLKP